MRRKIIQKIRGKARRRARVSDGTRSDKRKEKKAAWANSHADVSCVIMRKRRGCE